MLKHQEQPENKDQLVNKKNPLFMVITLLLVFYTVFLLGRSIYDNYRIKNTEQRLNLEIDILNQQNQALKNSLTYYQSDSYLEKAARIHLNLQEPGEHVIALSEKPQSQVNSSATPQPGQPAGPTDVPNFSKWINYLFGV